MKFLSETEQQSHTLLESPFSQNQASHASFSEHPTVKKNYPGNEYGSFA